MKLETFYLAVKRSTKITHHALFLGGYSTLFLVCSSF